jgi:hypothetical protein
MLILDSTASNGSTFLIRVTFADESCNPVVPDSILWTLTDSDDEIVNLREDVEVTTPEASIVIVLQGDDIALSGTGREIRTLTVNAEYTSSTYGSGLPLVESASFYVE